MRFYEELKSLLSKEEKFISGNELLKNKIIECALKLDNDLITKNFFQILIQHLKIKLDLLMKMVNI